VKNITRGLSMLKWWSTKLVPLKDMPDVLVVDRREEADFAVGQWVRVKKRGVYTGDLGQVMQV
jgi:hypothetical protein